MSFGFCSFCLNIVYGKPHFTSTFPFLYFQFSHSFTIINLKCPIFRVASASSRYKKNLPNVKIYCWYKNHRHPNISNVLIRNNQSIPMRYLYTPGLLAKSWIRLSLPYIVIVLFIASTWVIILWILLYKNSIKKLFR